MLSLLSSLSITLQVASGAPRYLVIYLRCFCQDGVASFSRRYREDIEKIASSKVRPTLGKFAESFHFFISFIPTFLHKNVSRFCCLSQKHSENTLPKNGRFLGVSGVDIIIYIVYIIFFRRYMHFAHKVV